MFKLVGKWLGKMFSSKAKGNPSRSRAKPHLEMLEDRIVPSVSTPNPQPFVITASPPAEAEVRAFQSDVLSLVEQRVQQIATLVQDADNILNALDQELVQEVAALQLQAFRILGINPNTPNQSLNAASQPGSDWGAGRGNASGSGSGSGTTTTQISHNPQRNNSLSDNGNGSGSGNSATSSHAIRSGQGSIKMQPMASGGGGSGSGGIDTYEWDPGVGYWMYGTGSNSGISYEVTTPNNLLASNPVNWMKNGGQQEIPIPQQPTTPGNKPTDIAILGWGSAGSAGQDPIEWNGNFTFSTLDLENGYTAQQTLDSGDTLDLDAENGESLSMDASSVLDQNLGPNSNTIYNGSNELKTFNITGDQTASVIINTGTTTIAASDNYTEKIGVPLVINKGATLNDKSLTTLNLTAGNLIITVKGEMDTSYGPNNANTLIRAQGQTGCYIDVSGGTLKYSGLSNTKDTIAIPVLVENSGNLTVSGGGTIAWLIVTGQVAQTQNNSVYMTSGSVNLVDIATLECDNDYRQDNGTLQTTDETTCTLQDGANSGGTAVINGGTLKVNGGASSGQFNVNAAALNFGGTFAVGIQGNQSGQQGLLKVTGSMNLQVGNDLEVTINGQLGNGQWTIIDTNAKNIAQFTNGKNPAAGLTGHNNQPNNGDYQLTSP